MPENEQKITVAIELGSSKARAIAGTRDEDGSVRILAVATQDSTSFIRRGTVYNINKTAECIKELKQSLEVQLSRTIKSIAMTGISGQSLHAVEFKTLKEFDSPQIIDNSTLIGLEDKAYGSQDDQHKIIEVIRQEFKVGSTYEVDPVGVSTTSIEGNYRTLVINQAYQKNLEDVFNIANITLNDTKPSPRLLADYILTDNEKANGCALVDLGASTTTIVIVQNSIVRNVVVLPLGSSNITKDICASKQISEAEAEQLKKRHGSAISDSDGKEEINEINMSNGETLKISDLNRIIEARVIEILKNVDNIIKLSIVPEKLTQGIVLTGGGANLKKIDKAVKKNCQVDKCVIRKELPNIMPQYAHEDLSDGSFNSLLCMLVSACNQRNSINCCEPLPKEKPQEEPTQKEFVFTEEQIGEEITSEEPTFTPQDESVKRVSSAEIIERDQKNLEEKKRKLEEQERLKAERERQREDKEWKDAQGNAKRLKAFIRNWPDSEHVDEAEAAIEEINANKAPSAFKSFIDKVQNWGSSMLGNLEEKDDE